MSDPVKAIADAVLYEGYVLWPYRRSALKNQRRWTFGGVFPPAHAERHRDDRAAVRAEMVLDGATLADVDVRVRFLQVVHRQVLDGGSPVDELRLGDERWLTWEEAVEREVGPGPFVVAAGEEAEPPVVRTWQELSGTVEVASDDAGRVRVEVRNTTSWDGTDRERALAHTLCSLHVVLRARSGHWQSCADPPPGAPACRSEGLWPVLVDDRTILASPIILEDRPRIASESPGDLFDGGEIDQLLVLNVLALTDEEKAEVRASDPRTRELLERTEALTPEQLMRLHGMVREAAW